MDNTPMYVTLPQDDFTELQAAAWASPPKTPGDRVGFALTTIVWFSAATVAVAVSSKSVAKAMDWFEEKKYQREQRDNVFAKNPS